MANLPCCVWDPYSRFCVIPVISFQNDLCFFDRFQVESKWSWEVELALLGIAVVFVGFFHGDSSFLWLPWGSEICWFVIIWDGNFWGAMLNFRWVFVLWIEVWGLKFWKRVVSLISTPFCPFGVVFVTWFLLPTVVMYVKVPGGCAGWTSVLAPRGTNLCVSASRFDACALPTWVHDETGGIWWKEWS